MRAVELDDPPTPQGLLEFAVVALRGDEEADHEADIRMADLVMATSHIEGPHEGYCIRLQARPGNL